MISRRWLWLALAVALLGYGVHLGLERKHAPGPRSVDTHDAGPVTVRTPAPVLDPTSLPGPGIAIAAIEAESGRPWVGKLTAHAADNSTHPTITLDEHGRGRLPLAAGRWHLDISGGALLDGRTWDVSDTPPPLVTVRVSTVPRTDAQPEPPPAGAATLVGNATLGGAHSADLVVHAFWLGDVGPGKPATLDRIPAPRPVAPLRLLGRGGAWKLDGLPPGGYAVLLVEPGRGAALVRTTATAGLAGDASAALADAAGLSGTVVDQRGGVVEGASIRALSDQIEVAHTTSTAGGTYTLGDLPPGKLLIETRAPGCFGERAEVTLEPGKRPSRKAEIVCETEAEDDPVP